MRRLTCLLGAAVIVAAALVAAAPASASTTITSVSAGHWLRMGQSLVSPHRTFRAYLRTSSGRLVVVAASGKVRWYSPATARAVHLSMGPGGNLGIRTRSRTLWGTNTNGSGKHVVLRMRDSGVLALTSGNALVWSSSFGNGCGRSRGRTFVADLSRQQAWLCAGRQLQRATYITSGASARGNGTPRGAWRVQARVRRTTLRPASGGAYRVRYWMPYHGAYGIHDSSWQKFPYGSSKYKTRGSHGCIHVPMPMMGWLFNWARVGTTVRIHR